MAELKIITFLNKIKSQPGTTGKFPDFHTFGKGPASETEIQALEKFIGHMLPDEHKAILTTFGSCTFDGKEDSITFFPVNELINDIAPIKHWDSDMDNTSIIAADNGGTLFFYDLINQTGRGVNSIFYCYPGNMSWEYSLFLGTSLYDVLIDMMNGTDLFDRPSGIL